MSVHGEAIDWHGRCPYCNCKMNSTVMHPRQRTKDHIVPEYRGGQTLGNLIFACHTCNEDKGLLTLLEWRVIRLMRGRSPFLAWDRDWPGVVWRELKFHVRWPVWVADVVWH